MYKVLFGQHIWGHQKDFEKFLRNLEENRIQKLICFEFLGEIGCFSEVAVILVNLLLKATSFNSGDRPSSEEMLRILEYCYEYADEIVNSGD